MLREPIAYTSQELLDSTSWPGSLILRGLECTYIEFS